MLPSKLTERALSLQIFLLRSPRTVMAVWVWILNKIITVVAPRSGLAVKKFIDVGAGVVDCDYRGPLGVVLFNFGDEDFEGMNGT